MSSSELTSAETKPTSLIDPSTGMEFDLGGCLRVRLINPTTADIAATARILGPPEPFTTEPAAVTIRYLPTLDPAVLHYLGYNRFGFSEDQLYVLGRRDGIPKGNVPFGELDEPFEISCRQGIGAAPFLIELLGMALLARGHVLVHGSAIEYRGRGILISGWNKGGKTETLLAFSDHGMAYIGDEWVVLSPDDGMIWGLPFPVTVHDWQMDQMGVERPALTLAERVRIRIAAGLAAAYQRGWRDPAGVLFRLFPALQRQRSITRAPSTLFNKIVQQAPLTDVILAFSSRSNDMVVQRGSLEEDVTRLIETTADEQHEFYESYRAFRFAFPDHPATLIDSVAERQRRLLMRALQGKKLIHFWHPYPVNLASIYQTLTEALEGGSS